MQILNSIFKWQYFGILVAVWAVIDLVWIDRWRALLGRISKLFSAPWIFEKDTRPQEHPFYPRKFLEQLAQNNITVGRADSGSGNSLSRWWKALGERVFTQVSPLISIGHILCLIFFLFFIYADAVTVANTLVLIGVEGTLPPILQRLDLAILGGALISATVGVWIFIEMFGKGEFFPTETMSRAQKTVFKLLSVLVTLFSVIVMLALAGQRLISLGMYASSPAVDFGISFALYGLLAINSSLAAALTFSSGALGVIVILFLVSLVLAIVMPALIFLLDIAWRIVIIVIDIVVWALFTPPMALPYGVGRLFGLIKPG